MLLRLLGDDCRSAMVIGHNPGLQDLVLRLARESPARRSVAEKFPTAALAALELDRSWRAIGPGSASLTGFTTPRALRDSWLNRRIASPTVGV